MEQESNLINVKNTNEIAKSVFDHPLIINTLSSQQLADISRFSEFLHQELSVFLRLFLMFVATTIIVFCDNGRIFTFSGSRIQTCSCLTLSSL